MAGTPVKFLKLWEAEDRDSCYKPSSLVNELMNNQLRQLMETIRLGTASQCLFPKYTKKAETVQYEVLSFPLRLHWGVIIKNNGAALSDIARYSLALASLQVLSI